MNLKNLKKLKGFSIVVIPSGGGLGSKSHNFSSGKAGAIIGIYTLIILFLGFFILNLTPLKSLIFPGNANLSPSEKKLVNELNQRMMFLAKELENLKSTNQQLKDAIILGDSTLIDSLTNKINDQEKPKGNPFGGDIFALVQKLFMQKSQDSITVQYKTIHFNMPVRGFISRGFNPDNGHMGIDIVVKSETPVYAAASGFVIFADYTVRDGYMIIINHPDGYISVYKHCSALLKKARDIVFEGEIIALSGNTGEITTGPHLHFEIWKNGKPVDPKNLLINY